MITSASTSLGGAPKFPAVASPSVDLDSAIQILAGVARCFSIVALSPVDLHICQNTLFICQRPMSQEPFVLQFQALALPPDSWETMHLQQDWFQEYFAHQVAMSRTFLVEPQWQVGHLPEGQFPPQLSARARVMRKTMTMAFISLQEFLSIYQIE